MTDIGEGDLFDEVEERLKVCQGELTTTRQQVAVLQQELVDNTQTQVHSFFAVHSANLLKVLKKYIK